MDRIAVLIPCYNEAMTVQSVVTAFQSALPEATIYVYDNNSTDGTDELAAQAGAVVRYERHQGKGNVIRRMFREVEADCYVLVDGDDTYPAESAREMVDEVLLHQADMVVGDRLSSTYFDENKRPFHGVGNLLVRACVNRFFGGDIRDLMTGYRAMSYQFVKTFPVTTEGFEIETEMSIHAIDKNLQVSHVLVDYRDRREGSESKLNTFSDGARVLLTMLRFYRLYHPLPFFAVCSLMLVLLSLAFFVPVFVEYLQTGLVDRIPTLIVCGFTALAAIVSFFAGMVLASIQQQNRQEFEMELIRIHRNG